MRRMGWIDPLEAREVDCDSGGICNSTAIRYAFPVDALETWMRGGEGRRRGGEEGRSGS